MRRIGRIGSTGLAAAVAAAIGIGAVPLPALAASVTQYGTVVFVADGDTIDVDVQGDGTTTPRRVRMAGIQAMELHTYKINLVLATGECHGVEATARLRALLGGKRVVGGTELTDGATVRLTARNASSSSRGRDERYVAYKGADGGWHDAGRALVKEGLVLPQPHPLEYTYNRSYRVLARKAAAAHIGIWDRDSCGTRPSPAAALAVAVAWDAPGDDTRNINGEHVTITNRGSSPVDLAGWWLRDSALRRYTFRSGTALAPGASLFVHAGRGTTTRTAAGFHFYWGQTTPVFENVTTAPTWMGDGAYLFDTRGNLRAWKQYGRV